MSELNRLNNKNLTIYSNNINHSHILSNFNGSVRINNDLFIGFRKPVNHFYFDLVEVNPLIKECVMTVEKFNGVEWVECEINDETNGLSENGFVYIEPVKKEQPSINEGKELYWTKISLSNNSDVLMRLCSIVFCDEKDIMKRDSTIYHFYPYDESKNLIKSHALALMGSRDWIMTEINKLGKSKSYNGIHTHLMNYWDLMNIDEVRDIAVDIFLWIVYDNANDSDGYYKTQRDILYKRAINNFNRFTGGYMLTLDINDNGKIDETDKIASTMIVQKVIR